MASAEYEALLERFCADPPHVGYSHVGQLGELSDADLGAVLAENPGLLGDALDDDVARVAARYLAGNESSFMVTARMGALLIAALRPEIERYLLRQVICECDVREQERLQDVADLRHGRLSQEPA